MIGTITNMEMFKGVLIDAGLKPTSQRLKIIEYINKHKCDHPTAEDIYRTVHKKLPVISMTTVYNTLKALLDRNVVTAVTITGKEIHYDFNLGPHHHFLCKKCGQIIDINIACPISTDKFKSYAGNIIDEIHGYFKGTCKHCQSKKKGEYHGVRH